MKPVLPNKQFQRTVPASRGPPLNCGVSLHMESLSFTLGGERERVEVLVIGYEREATGDYNDDNWVNVEVQLNTGGFKGQFQATFVTAELVEFRDRLLALQKNPKGQATFCTLEDQLTLSLTGNARGAIQLDGSAADQPGIGNKLTFQLGLDQSYLGKTISELNAIIQRFPIRAG